ncbi:MAG: hypothetical protein ABR565_00815 [Gammaproteobacteria bacterium]
MRYGVVFMVCAAAAAAGCATAPPQRTENICEIFEHEPRWYDHARRSEARWGTPISVQIAIVNQESSFRHNVRPPRPRLFGFIPLPRRSSAYGYAQAQSPAWSDYLQATGRRGARRSNIADALDFIGWYNDVSNQRLGIAKANAEHLYLAYHEGHGGYSRSTYRNKPQVVRVAQRVGHQSRAYAEQLPGCERKLRCRRFYQFWPFCR